MALLQDPSYEVILKGAPERVLELCAANEQIFSNLRSWDATVWFHQSKWSCILLPAVVCRVCRGSLMDRHAVFSCEYLFCCVSRLAKGLRILALAGRRLSAQDIPHNGEFQGGIPRRT